LDLVGFSSTPRTFPISIRSPDRTKVPVIEVSDCPAGSVRVLPYSLIGQNILKAARAAEGVDRSFAPQIARGMLCNHQGSILKRHLLEYKAFAQVRRNFSPGQLVTIYLNKAYFGDGGKGIENAAEHYYGKRLRSWTWHRLQ
jgi:hypothetical protein